MAATTIALRPDEGILRLSQGGFCFTNAGIELISFWSIILRALPEDTVSHDDIYGLEAVFPSSLLLD